jgi:hypothetical protein
MSKEFKPQVIGHNKDAELSHMNIVGSKKLRFNELISYLKEFISVEDINAFNGRIYDEAISRFTEKHHANYPTLRIEKVAELHDMSLHKLDSLIKSFNALEMEWDLEKNEPIETPDFRILTKSEAENKTYKLLTNIIHSIEEAQAEGMNFYPSPILSGFNGWMQYDFNTGKIVPNISRIQGTERNY